ncbi:SGNH/GDSL hydrolase family protein [Lunatimonas lonarensis]|nr:SGNH/GDSL hydrolase family protein [Lunatimonas lonarensis]
MGSFIVSCASRSKPVAFDPPTNGRIVIVGNTFAEQLQNTNYFETFLYRNFPDRKLVVRNLGWSGDEVDLQPRPLDFGSLEENLGYHKPDYIFAFFGMNEAFQGADGLPGFEQNLRSYLQKISTEAHNGKSPPQVILFSPIYHEEIGGLLPSPDAHNGQLKAYTRKMAEVAEQLNIPFVDLYSESKRLMNRTDEPLTYNGIHLTEVGYRLVGEIMAASLGFQGIGV